MKINEFTQHDDMKLPFDVVDDTIVFMRNDPQFYRKHYFPAVAKLADIFRAKKEINDKSVLGSMVDQGMQTYCKKYNLARRPADIFSLEDRQAILDKITSEEIKNIEQGDY
jgi:hypothetical protein